jgi:outer membrane protein
MADIADHEIDRAFVQRPELMQQIARVRAADASIRQGRSAYFPTLDFSGNQGWVRAYGQQDLYPGVYAQDKVWDDEVDLRWTIFDGTRREHQIAEAKADKRAAQATVDAWRDQIANETWAAYSNMKTALRRQQSAEALLAASTDSYESARQSYG